MMFFRFSWWLVLKFIIMTLEDEYQKEDSLKKLWWFINKFRRYNYLFNLSTKNEKNGGFRSLSYKKYHKRQNDRSIYSGALVGKLLKKLFEVTGLKKAQFLKVFRVIYQMFYRSCDCAFNPSGHFVFYEILRSSNFFSRTSPRWYSRGLSGGWT